MEPRKFVKRQKLEEAITFFEEDAEGVQFLHNDMVVVSLNIINYDVCYILIDNESSINILFYDVFSKMGISSDRLGRLDSLIGFTKDTMLAKRVMILLVTAG